MKAIKSARPPIPPNQRQILEKIIPEREKRKREEEQEVGIPLYDYDVPPDLPGHQPDPKETEFVWQMNKDNLAEEEIIGRADLGLSDILSADTDLNGDDIAFDIDTTAPPPSFDLDAALTDIGVLASESVDLTDQLAQDQERQLASLLPNDGQARTAELLLTRAITNGRHNAVATIGQVRTGATNNRATEIFRAGLRTAPHIKWYPRLAKILKRSEFKGNKDDSLTISLAGAPALVPAIRADINQDVSSPSPMIAALSRALAELDQTANTRRDVTSTTHKINGRITNPDGGDLDLAGACEPDRNDGSQFDDSPEIAQLVQGDSRPSSRFDISLLDYSNKSIAELYTGTEEEKRPDHPSLVAQLQSEGFSKQRISDIMAMVRLTKLNKALADQRPTLASLLTRRTARPDLEDSDPFQ